MAADDVGLEVMEILDAETHVDVLRLTDLCLHGRIPEPLRAETWKYLLSISLPEKSEDIKRAKRLDHEFEEFERSPGPTSVDDDIFLHVQKDVIPRYSRFPRDAQAAMCLQAQHVLLRYLHLHPWEYQSGMSDLLVPLTHLFKSERDQYLCFEALMGRVHERLTDEGCRSLIVTFNTLFRHTLPELYHYFEDESVSPSTWLPSWMRFLFAPELPLPCLLRLWDVYFAGEQRLETRAPPYELHTYVCLAVLQTCQEELLELDGGEVSWFLQHLPVLDVDQLITVARNVRDDVHGRELI